MNSQHIKSVNTDGRSKKRLTFATSKKRSKLASADTYRTFHGRRVGQGTSAASREEQVHNPRPKKKGKTQLGVAGKAEQTKDAAELDDSGSDVESAETNFAIELDVTLDRNCSQVFASFHREVWHLARSLPEILHHADKIIDLVLAYMLSPDTAPEMKSSLDSKSMAGTKRARYITNHATTDILHLLAVLARDLRHEIHPYLHQKIIPRILSDLLHPPATDDNKQQVPLDVSLVEAAFRTMSYIFRYDAEALLFEGSEKEEPCLEPIRPYYGMILASRRQLVRRLGAETFAPLVRKLPDATRKRHLKRLLRALVRNEAGDSPAVQRLRADACDGIATFLLEIARGVRGRLHSKGIVVIKAVVEVMSKQDDNESGCELLMIVGEEFMDRLRRHLDTPNLVSVFQTIVAASKPCQAVAKGNVPESVRGLIGSLRMIGRLSANQALLPDIMLLFSKLLETNLYDGLSSEFQTSILDILSSVWKQVADQSQFDSRMNGKIRLLLQSCLSSGLGFSNGSDLAKSHAFTIAFDLLYCLPVEGAVATVGSALLSMAGSLESLDIDATLALAFAVTRTRDKDIDAGGNDSLFDLNVAKHCAIGEKEREMLLAKLLLFVERDDWATATKVSKAGIAVQCLAFIAANRADDPMADSTYKRVARGLIDVMTIASTYVTNDVDMKHKILLTFSLAIESLACLSSLQLQGAKKDTVVTKYLQKSAKFVSDHLLANPNSLWAIKTCASFVRALEAVGSRLDVDFNEAFEALVPNLRSQNHFLRLHTLEILASFPSRPFTVDHADLDLTGDLDEEPTTGGPTERESSAILGGISDLSSLLLSIESSPISLAHEREMLSQISRVGILGRAGRLPLYHAEAAANHLVGLLHVKFAPMWPTVVQALVSLSKGHEGVVWAPLFDSIQSLMDKLPVHEEPPTSIDTNGHGDSLVNPDVYYSSCLEWAESAHGSYSPPALFQNDVAACHEMGVVSKHESVNEATVLDWLWKVLENAPDLIGRHAESVAPCLLRFIQEQYFMGSRTDPDARELQIFELTSCRR